jgi:ABC-type transport system involved in multi-copper enzyme maturation permease subunit
MKAWTALANWTWRNPVTLKELRIGLRERRIFILQLLYLFLLLGLSLMILPEIFNHRNSEQLAESGKSFFLVLFWVQLLLLIFTTPALTCGSLSGERERHSLDMVLASRLTSGELVAGKLGFAAYCLILLLFSALPLASICFFLGGVSLWEALGSYLELFLFGMLGASVGLFSSARESRSNYSTVQSYLMILISTFALPFYGALRFEGTQTTLPVGPYFWTFQQVWEIGAYHFFVGTALYFITFLFLKARHRLRPQARNLKGMAWSFLLYYLFCLGWVGLAVAAQGVSAAHHDIDPLAFLIYLAHIGTLGFFLNPANLESARERAEYRRSPFSHKIFWLLLFGVGCTTPMWMSQTTGQAGWGLDGGFGYTLFFLLVYPLNVWFFQQAWLPRWQFAWVYYLGLVLLQFVPALGSFAPDDSTWRLYFVSPFLTLLSIMSPDKTSDHTLQLALLFQGGGVVLLGLLYGWRRGRQKRS